MPALWMLGRGLWPEDFAKRVAVSEGSVGKSLLIGLVPLALSIVLVTATGKKLGALAVILAAAVLVWGLMGAAGIASLIGERLWPTSEPWKQTRNGGLVVICCALIPVVGWFVFLPLIAVIGMGINTRCLLGSSKPATVSAPPSVPATNAA
jgi:uncharacterized membrane protein YhaH (DUF805 family)